MDEMLFFEYYEGLLNLNKCSSSPYACYDDGFQEVDCDNENALFHECDYYESFYLQFQEAFKIPFAGGRNYNNAKISSLDIINYGAFLWSSSPNINYPTEVIYL